MAGGFLGRAELSAGSAMSLGALILKNQVTRLGGDDAYPDDSDAPRPFKPHYDKFILPHVQQFEMRRVAALADFRTRLFLGIPAGLAIAVVALFGVATFEKASDFLGWGALALTALVAVWVSMPISNYKSSVKEKIFPAIFSFFGPDFEYAPKGRLAIEQLKESGIIPKYDDASTEDYVCGSYQMVKIEVTEAVLTEKRSSGKNSSDVTVFRGAFILLGMNKRFSGRTVVRRDQGSVGNWFAGKPKGMEAVKLEDPVFERQFEVSSTDQVEARYLLTTSFMERMLKLAAAMGGEKIQCSFYDDRLLLMVESSHDRFETSSVFQPSTFVEDIRTINEEMQEIFQIIDILKLHERTGL